MGDGFRVWGLGFIGCEEQVIGPAPGLVRHKGKPETPKPLH